MNEVSGRLQGELTKRIQQLRSACHSLEFARQEALLGELRGEPSSSTEIDVKIALAKRRLAKLESELDRLNTFALRRLTRGGVA